jgi:hypothetical protein
MNTYLKCECGATASFCDISVFHKRAVATMISEWNARHENCPEPAGHECDWCGKQPKAAFLVRNPERRELTDDDDLVCENCYGYLIDETEIFGNGAFDEAIAQIRKDRSS